MNHSNVLSTSTHETGITATIQLSISNDHGIPVFQDFLTEVQRMFDVEKNIKNNLYAFILREGLFDKLVDYERSTNMLSPDGYTRAINGLLINKLSTI